MKFIWRIDGSIPEAEKLSRNKYIVQTVIIWKRLTSQGCTLDGFVGNYPDYPPEIFTL
jgi:hypothetical protein